MVKRMNEMNPMVCRRRCFLINLTYFVVIAAIIFLALRYAMSALMPFIIAAVTAALLRPVLNLLNKKLHLPRKPVGIVLTVVFYLLIAFLGLILFSRLLDAATAFLRALPSLWNDTMMPALSDLASMLTDKLAQMNVKLNFSADEMLGHLGSDITSLSRDCVG